MDLQRFLLCIANFNFYLWNEVLLFQQPLHNHHARLLQLCKFAKTLHKLPQPCENLVKTLSQPYKVAARLLQPSYFRMVMYCT